MQLHLSAKGENLDYIRTRVDQLVTAFPWVQMVLLSELAVHGPVHANAEPLPGPTEDSLAELAARHDIWLITGSLYERHEDKVYNTCSVINPKGQVIARYRKIFPFQPFSAGTSPGDEFVVFDVPGIGRFGISICYDIWFPEHSRTLVAMGAEVILHPVLTATTDREVELSIARATAVVNQCYVIDVNGVAGGGVGRSLFVGPEGDVIHQAGPNEALLPLEIDLDRVRRVRERGIHTLGQPLKSFRDAPVRFEVYDPDSPLRAYLHTLGPLEKPGRPSPPDPAAMASEAMTAKEPR
ncbi:MAG: carbon-nitrogen hydrolase family protein [Myxococcales bacterium]|nr:carbon-nitrogen hydrolase family protein [Myxococcales bacterium]